MSESKSGDLCRFGREPFTVEHYRCDDYRDGTITDVRNGRIIKHAHYSAPKGFERKA